jgi:hypothetical protein
MENNDPKEEYYKWKEKENSPFTKISRKVNPAWIIAFFGLIFLANYLVTSGQMSRGTFFLFLAVIGLVFLFLTFKEDKVLKELPEQVCKQIALEAMEVKRKEGIEFPSDSKVRVTPISGTCYEQDLITGTSGITKREVGVEVIIKNRLKKSYIISMNPFTGVIRDIIPKPLGINSKDSLGKDKQIIPVQFLDNKI